jgi:hypothetical protein
MNNWMPTALSFSTPARASVASSQIVAGYDSVVSTVAKNAPKNEAAFCPTDICQDDKMAEPLSCKIDLKHRKSMHKLADYSKYVQALRARVAQLEAGMASKPA